MRPSGCQISYHMLEANRACTTNQNESNFHVFYTLLYGSPNDLLKNLCLDKTTYYSISISKYTIQSIAQSLIALAKNLQILSSFS